MTRAPNELDAPREPLHNVRLVAFLREGDRSAELATLDAVLKNT
jgi:hypothetical protein